MTDNIFFIKDHIQARITPNKPVNKSGYVYAGREYKDLMVEIIILKDDGSDYIAVDKSRAPVRMRESRMTSAQLSLRKGEHDDGNDPCK